MLSAIAGKLASKGATSEEIVAILRKNHPRIIADESEDILQIGLIKLAGEVCGQRSGVKSSVQLEMFEEYAIPKMLTFTVNDAKGIRKVHKAVMAMTLSEVRGYVAEKTRPRSSRSERISEGVKELRRMVDDLSKFGRSANSTIDECWAAARRAAK